MVVEYLHQCGDDGTIYLRIFVLLLFPSKWNEWCASILLLLWVHVYHFVCFLPDVGKRRVPFQSALREAHLFTGQM